MSLDINTAGCEFVKSVLKLYRAEKYFREKEILAHKLLDSAIEAGSNITELCFCPESRENEFAEKAMEELSRAMFVLKIMSDEGIYPKRKVEPVISLGREAKELIEPYLRVEKRQPETVEPEESPEPVAPVPEKPVIPHHTEENAVSHSDFGGFEEVYTDEKK